MKRLCAIAVAAALVAAGLVQFAAVSPVLAAAGDKAKPLGIGDAAPAWSELIGTDDKPHSLKDLAKAKAVVVVFTCNECPVAQAYEGRLSAMAKAYKDKCVEIVAVNSNNGESDELPAMKERADHGKFAFAYVDDPSQELPRAYSATVTPHVFLLDKDRKVVYMGAVDDEMDESLVKHHWLRDALDDVLAGRAPKVKTSQQHGCGIRYE